MIVKIPRKEAPEIIDEVSEDTKRDINFSSVVRDRIKVNRQIAHEKEVNKVRYMPQDNHILATMTTSGEVHLFDSRNHKSISEECKVSPELILKGHSDEGYGISWNPNKNGILVTWADDRLICIWDVNKKKVVNKCISPLIELNEHDLGVEDVWWHKSDENVFGSVSDDWTIKLWDIRDCDQSKFTIKEHLKAVLSLDFSSFEHNLFITGSNDCLF